MSTADPLPAEYTARARARLGTLEAPQLVAVAVSPDGDEARALTRRFVTMYLGGQPHIAAELGLDPELVERLTSLIGTWPPPPGAVEEAESLVGPEIVDRLAVAGTAAECRERIGAWTDAGASYPLVVPLTENVAEIAEALRP